MKFQVTARILDGSDQQVERTVEANNADEAQELFEMQFRQEYGDVIDQPLFEVIHVASV